MVIKPLDDRTLIVLDLRPPICGFGESCAIVHCITSQPANVSFLKCALLAFLSISNRFPAMLKVGFFRRLAWGFCEGVGRVYRHAIAGSLVPISSLLTRMIGLTVFSYSAGPKNVSACLTGLPPPPQTATTTLY